MMYALRSTPPEGCDKTIPCEGPDGTGCLNLVISDADEACPVCDGDGVMPNPIECRCAECREERRHDQEMADERGAQ